MIFQHIPKGVFTEHTVAEEPKKKVFNERESKRQGD